MKTLKKILLGLAIFIALFLIIGMFFPKHLQLQREIVIKAPVEMVFDQVNNLRQWEYWSPWHGKDSTMKISYMNSGIGQDASYSWMSEKMGNGKLTITYSHPFDTIKNLLDFGKQGTAFANYSFKQTPEGVHVTWEFNSDLGSGPIGRWMGVFMRPMLEEQYDEGLKNLDTLCLSLQTKDWFYVKIKTKESFNYISLTQVVTFPEMQNAMELMYGKLMKTVEKNGLKVTDAPIALYHTWGETIQLECGLIIEPTNLELLEVDKKVMPEQKYAVIKFLGLYDGLERAHIYMDSFIKKNMIEVSGAPIEKYKTDPMMEPDPSKWITYIMYPIK